LSDLDLIREEQLAVDRHRQRGVECLQGRGGEGNASFDRSGRYVEIPVDASAVVPTFAVDAAIIGAV